MWMKTAQSRKDHPHGCGEKCKLTKIVGAVQGSPPRVRGKDHLIRGIIAPKRITPAGAGKRDSAMHPHLCRPDHPRGCGEKPFFRWALNPPLGSPPRVRGKDGQEDNQILIEGITPAGAGKRFPRKTEAF